MKTMSMLSNTRANYENNDVLHRLSIFRISITQLLILRGIPMTSERMHHDIAETLRTSSEFLPFDLSQVCMFRWQKMDTIFCVA